MAFQLKSGTLTVLLDTCDEPILSTLPRVFQLDTPQCDRMWQQFYGRPWLRSPAEITQFRNEIVKISAAYERRRRSELAVERKVRARDRSVLDRTLRSLLANDHILLKCSELVALCDEALLLGAPIEAEGD